MLTPRRVLLFTVELAFFALLSGVRSASAESKSSSPLVLVENTHIQVGVAPQSGSIYVADKRNGRVWRQPTRSAYDAAIPRAAGAPSIDGTISEWPEPPLISLTYKMTADSKQIDSEKDCSASIWLAWDDLNLYVAARVRDDVLEFGPWEGIWWQRDSLEFWVGDTLVPLELNPASPGPAKVSGPAIKVVMAVRPETGAYVVELAAPWTNFPAADRPGPGTRFRFAIGINDSDATGDRQGQLYFPPTRRHANPSTYDWAALAGNTGAVPPPPPPAIAVFRSVKRRDDHCGMSFETDCGETNGRPNTFEVALTLPDDAPDLTIVATPRDPEAPLGAAPFLECFALETPDGVAAMADYCNGHLYPLDTAPFPKPYQAVCGLDMPWVGICDLAKGFGYSLILESPEDADLAFESCRMDGRALAVPRIVWLGSMRKAAYPRSMRYHFTVEGGYVALAKDYRAYAKEHGLLVTLEEKAKKNPRVKRLYGAADVWGAGDMESYVTQLKAGGVERALVQSGDRGKPSAETLRAIDQLGYLSGQYDNYTDALQLAEGGALDFQHDRMPDNAPLDAQGNRILGWIALDGLKYYKRCPARWMPAAQADIPRILAQQPYTARFIDVTTAEGLYECFDPVHPVTRRAKRELGEQVLAYVGSRGLVVGGEHGKWWAVPHVSYFEGMMSGYYWFWPAGHLVKPKSKDEKFENIPVYPLVDWATYEKWDIGHRWRAPLWELVFHDCVITTWYWGDTNLWLQQAAPEITAKKELYNLLYATIPMFWQDDWNNRRELLLRAYWTTSHWHEATAGTEMISHEFLSPDHALQRTRFSNGAEIVVHFGSAQTTIPGHAGVVLPASGFVGTAPGIELSRVLNNGATVTIVRSKDFYYSDVFGTDVALRRSSPNEIRAWLGPSPRPITLPTRDLAPDIDPTRLQATQLDQEGQNSQPLPLTTKPGPTIEAGPFDKPTTLLLLLSNGAHK
ncbi:MAG: hypothetical protein HZB26_26755 [Candidatus Hydrogenedentes bacterium]|nr:hypothetical protein [Candidatus Hydrogenedentota bacterium]